MKKKTNLKQYKKRKNNMDTQEKMNEELKAAAEEAAENTMDEPTETAPAEEEEPAPKKPEPVKEKKEKAPSAPSVSITVNVNGKDLTLSGKPAYVFVDIFDHIDFDLQSVKGNKLVTEVNGQKAEYMQPINNGDVILVRWEK